MLPALLSFSAPHRDTCLALAAASPECRAAVEESAQGFRTEHFVSQLVCRGTCERVELRPERLFVDEAVPRAHAVTIRTPETDGGVPHSLVAAAWWLAKERLQAPITFIVDCESMTSLARLRGVAFAARVQVLYLTDPKSPVPPDYLSPLETFANLRKVCEFSPSGDARWMLSCPQLQYVDVIGYNRPPEWNIGDVLPSLPQLHEFILYEGTALTLDWLHRCTQLRKLKMDGCKWLTSFAPLRTMALLTHLHTLFEDLQDISALAHCKHLRSLNFGGSNTLVDASAVGALTELEQLDISHTGIISLEWIVGCRSLQSLSLFNVPLEPSPLQCLADLPKLRTISLILIGHFSFAWVHAKTPLEEVSVEMVEAGIESWDIEALRNTCFLKVFRAPCCTVGDWISHCTLLEKAEIQLHHGDVLAATRVLSLPHLRDLALNLPHDDAGGDGDDTDSSLSSSEGSVAVAAAAAVGEGENAVLCPASLTSLRLRGGGVAMQHVLSCVPHLSSLQSLQLHYVVANTDLSACCGLSQLRELEICDSSGAAGLLTAVGFLSSLRRLSVTNAPDWLRVDAPWTCATLETLSIRSCQNLTDLTPLADGPPMPFLSEVTLDNVPLSELPFLARVAAPLTLRLRSLSSLRHLTAASPDARMVNLQSLEVSDCPALQTLESISGCAGLTELTVENCPSIRDLEFLGSLTGLRELTMRELPPVEVVSLRCGTRLEHLRLTLCPAMRSLCLPPVGSRLITLHIDAAPLLSDLSALTRCLRLKMLILSKCGSLTHIPVTRQLAHLRSVTVRNIPQLSDVSVLAELPSLRSLSIDKCPAVKNVSALGQLRDLEGLGLMNVRLNDLSWLASCKALRSLSLSACKGATDYSAVGKLPGLHDVYISGCPLTDLSWVADMPCALIDSFEVTGCKGLTEEATANLPSFVKIRR